MSMIFQNVAKTYLTGRSDFIDENIKELLSYRVQGGGCVTYKSYVMTEDEASERRSYMRQLLKNTKRCNLSNNELDSSRITILNTGEFNGSYLFEDSKGNEFFISSGKINENQADFRKVRAMIPFEYLGKKGNDFNWGIYGNDMSTQRGLVNNYILHFQEFKSEGMGLYICSKIKGSGKTMLSCCILNEIAHRYAVSTKFVPILDLIELTKKDFRENQTLLNELYDASVLVIDDIGVQMAKEWVDTVLYKLINDRYNKKRITIYTSNIEMEQLKIDDRIIDRIDGTTYVIHIPEVSIRHNQKKKEKDDLLQKIKEKATT